MIDNTTYSYQNAAVSKGAGLVVSSTDKQNLEATLDTQCFGYDYADRLAQAWSATDACAATPKAGSSSTVGGAVAPYWQSWTYGGAGDRATQTDHNTAGVTANDTTTSYHYPASGSSVVQPHTLTSTSATGPAASANTASYGYDAAGETSGITGGSTGNQTLTWDTLGKLATDTTSAGVSSYVYDADGNLVVRRDPGSVTLFYGDEEIVLNTATNAVSGVRYYSMNGQVIAQRSSTGAVQYVFSDRLGTTGLAVAASDQTVTWRQYLPFGGVRGSPASSWLGDKGFVGAPADAVTTFTDLGAREYDPANGRFLSADPVLELSDPTQMGGYDYAGNDPVTRSDPSGLEPGSWCNTSACTQHDDAMHAGTAKACEGKCYDNTPYRSPVVHLGAQPITWVAPAPKPYVPAKPPVRHTHWYGGGGFWMNAGIVGLGIVDVAQLGLDPVTDGAELALIGTDVATTGGEEAVAEEGAAAAERAPKFVYRGGSRTADNLTPRPGVDSSGLSTFDSLDAGGFKPGSKVQVLDTSQLKCLCATSDAPPPGHVSIAPRDLSEVTDWAATRGTGEIHPYTQDLLDSIVDEIRIPK